MFNDCEHIRKYDDDKREVEYLHSKDKLNFKEIDFMLKFYKR